MSIFTPLKKFFKPTKREHEFKYGLTESEVQGLKSLSGNPEWDLYLRLLERISQLYGDQLLSDLVTQEQANYTRGVVAGLRMGPAVVANLIKDKPDERDNARHRAEQRSRQRDISLYGSQHWRTTF
jgi:hypothetical protein